MKFNTKRLKKLIRRKELGSDELKVKTSYKKDGHNNICVVEVRGIENKYDNLDHAIEILTTELHDENIDANVYADSESSIVATWKL